MPKPKKLTFPTFLVLDAQTKAKSYGEGRYAFPMDFLAQAGDVLSGDNGLNYVVLTTSGTISVAVKENGKIRFKNFREVIVEKEKEQKADQDDFGGFNEIADEGYLFDL